MSDEIFHAFDEILQTVQHIPSSPMHERQVTFTRSVKDASALLLSAGSDVAHQILHSIALRLCISWGSVGKQSLPPHIQLVLRLLRRVVEALGDAETIAFLTESLQSAALDLGVDEAVRVAAGAVALEVTGTLGPLETLCCTDVGLSVSHRLRAVTHLLTQTRAVVSETSLLQLLFDRSTAVAHAAAQVVIGSSPGGLLERLRDEPNLLRDAVLLPVVIDGRGRDASLLRALFRGAATLEGAMELVEELGLAGPLGFYAHEQMLSITEKFF